MGKKHMERAWYYLKFQASTGDLGTYSLRLREDCYRNLSFKRTALQEKKEDGTITPEFLDTSKLQVNIASPSPLPAG